MTKFLSRKFIIAMVFALSGSAALFLTNKLTGGEFVTLALGVIGAFTAGDVALNHIHKPQSPDGDGG